MQCDKFAAGSIMELIAYCLTSFTVSYMNVINVFSLLFVHFLGGNHCHKEGFMKRLIQIYLFPVFSSTYFHVAKFYSFAILNPAFFCLFF